MKILHVITSLQTGGAEKLMVEIIPQLINLGNEVELLVFNGVYTPFYKELEKKGIKIYNLGFYKNVYDIRNLFNLIKFFRKKSYDIVHTHNTAAQLFVAFLPKFKHFMITTEHNTNNRRRNWKWYKMIDRCMYSKYDKIICISNQAEINLKKYLGNTFNHKIITIYNGVNIDKFMNAVGNQSASNHKKIITMVAGFRSQKDQDTLIKAFSILPKNKFELWLVGDGERRNELEMLAKTEGVAENTKFWGIRQDVPCILKSSDLIVMSSHYEGLSLSSVEGMSVGKPFIASDVDGLHEITEGAGLLFKHGDYVQLANLILELTNDRKLYNKTAEKCLQRARQYDISKMVDGYIGVYQSLC